MAAPNLLNIDVDTLFERHSVQEIEQIEKMLQTEVEKKKEELRTMVGERYRDLLKAADTIAQMKETSNSLIKQIENISLDCKSLNEKQLIGFKTESQTLQNAKKRNLNSYFGTAVQIKLLTDLPELIWTQLDRENYLRATQLFIFSRHISTGLQIDSNKDLLKYFPVAKKQWSILSPFFFTIKQNVLSALERESLTPDAATDCILSLYLLEKSSFDKILNDFLQLRCKAYIKALSSEKGTHKRVKEKILTSLKVLNSTIELIFKCLIDSGCEDSKGLVTREIERLADENGPPTIELLEREDVEATANLPDIISKFRPAVEVPTISTDIIKKTTNSWLENIAGISKNQLQEVFNLISSMKTVQDIKDESLAIEKSNDWSKMCESLYLPSTLDFYKDFYQKLVNDKIKNIIEQSWTKAINETYNRIRDEISKSDTKNEIEYNLWIESSDDLPKSLKNALEQDKKCNRLLMKAKGYNKEIVEICTLFDKSLEEIFNDVDMLLEEKQSTFEEKESLVEFLKSLSQEKVTDLITRIKSVEHQKKEENYMFLARIFISFIELCPYLKLCLSHFLPSNWGKISGDKKNFEKWTKICNLLDEESFVLWKQFCDAFLINFDVKKEINMNIDLETILNDFVLWETITVEEKDEHDNAVQSTIRIPSQPRISLQMYLFKIIQSLNALVPQSLPRKVLYYFNAKIVKDIVNTYKDYLKSEFIAKNQNMALQLYFDLRFLQILFVERDDKIMQEEFQKLTSELKNNVDPFDFELFHSYLGTNVKKCVLRMQHEIGILIPNLESVAISIDMKQGGIVSQQERDPNVLCLSSNGSLTTWFPLLPIIVPSNNKTAASASVTVVEVEKTPMKSKAKKTEPTKPIPTAQQTAQNYASNVKSGAAAFFGAMSQDWFR